METNEIKISKALAKALADFHTKVGAISKDAKNPFFKSNYASLSNVLDTIREPLASSGLIFTQLPTGMNGLKTILMHVESGDFLESKMKMKPTKEDAQGTGSVLTYMRRYALISILGLNVSDDDGNGASKKPDKKKLPELKPGHAKWQGAVDGLNQRSITIAQVKQHYSLSEENEKKLCEIEKKAAEQTA